MAVATQTGTVAQTEAHDEHAEPTAFGVALFTPAFFIALAMLVVFAIMLRARVPALIAKGLDSRIADIRKQLSLTTVVIHPKESAACATAEGNWWVPGPYTSKPLLTTGAGDQYAAGFLFGLSQERSLADCGRLASIAAAEVISHYGPRPQVSLKDLAASKGL